MQMQPEARNLGYLISKTALRLKSRLAERLEELQLTPPQWSVLRDLASVQLARAEDGPNAVTSPAQIAARLEMDRPTMSGILDRLKKKGWIEITEHPSDRRSQLVQLSEEARRLFPELEQRSQEVLQQALQGLTVEELDLLKASLIKVLNNLEGLGEEEGEQ